MAEFDSICKYFGYPVISTEYMRETVQARKHKKKRINKKWLKRYGKKSVPSKDIVVADGKIYVHPKTLAKIEEKLRRAGDA